MFEVGESEEVETVEGLAVCDVEIFEVWKQSGQGVHFLGGYIASAVASLALLPLAIIELPYAELSKIDFAVLEQPYQVRTAQLGLVHT